MENTKYNYLDPVSNELKTGNASEITEYLLSKVVDNIISSEKMADILYKMITDGSFMLDEENINNSESTPIGQIDLIFESKVVNGKNINIIKDSDENMINISINVNDFINKEKTDDYKEVYSFSFPVLISDLKEHINSDASFLVQIATKINNNYKDSKFIKENN